MAHYDFEIPAPDLQRFRKAFQDALDSQLREDRTFEGPGHVFRLDVDFDETMNAVVRLAADEPDAYFDDPQPFDLFEQLAGDTHRVLVEFYVASMTSSSYGMDSFHILDRGYLYLPGDPSVDIPGEFIGVWEPAESGGAFEHAFITNYVEYARNEHDHTPVFEPGGWGNAIVAIGVPPRLFGRAIMAFLDIDPGAWGEVFGVMDADALPSSDEVAAAMAITTRSATVVLDAIRGDDQRFKEGIPQASLEEKLAALAIYLQHWGVLSVAPS